MSVNIKDKRVVVVDDSIVRGTTMKGFVKLLRDYGAREVHMRIACPPLTNPCFYGIDFPTKEELIASKFQEKEATNIEKIKEFSGADSLFYLSITGLLHAAGITGTTDKNFDTEKTPYCIACMSGNYKIPLASKAIGAKSPKSLAVLISNKGTGTNLKAIIDAINNKRINAKIAVVVSDTPNAPGLENAKKNKLTIEICRRQDNLLPLLKEKYPVDYVCLAGWKQVIPGKFIKVFKNKILNTHPGIVPDTIDGNFLNPDNTPAIWNRGKLTEKAMQNFFDKKSTFAGCTNLLLTQEFDFGPVLGRCFEKVEPDDTIDSLYTRLKRKENQLYVDVLKKLCNDTLI